MAWEISISAEGWGEIYEELGNWSKDDLIDALVADDSADYEGGDILAFMENLSKDYHKYASHESLVDEAFSRVQENNTCDNGGYAYWIDKEGYHKVVLRD